ncbi:hypothetical protein JTB14_000137 [Gonioctena quinquepunctata]|nr:hypothetical protein JTB14_000137 [Gonioctena quinquepunctata]
MYFCEDHFDLPNDMDNYMEYHVMGSVSQVRMKAGCFPTKFECQPDRRKRTSNITERPYILKKRRKILIEECEIYIPSLSLTNVWEYMNSNEDGSEYGLVDEQKHPKDTQFNKEVTYYLDHFKHL